VDDLAGAVEHDVAIVPREGTSTSRHTKRASISKKNPIK
jgi:hypothetical protein